ncbi:MAG: thiamine diphosphokinase, partial [Spirochaetaceae bacterium]|nr:thiamine diphosphokinase [Spirochaetaceae bacterium]
MNCIIFTGGKFPEKTKTAALLEPLKANSIVIAADSGLDAAKAYDIKPDFFLGDMDSVNAESLAWFKSHKKETAPQNIETFPEDKDFSDTELALHKAKSLGADFTALIGGSGGRLDHLLGILELFKG